MPVAAIGRKPPHTSRRHVTHAARALAAGVVAAGALSMATASAQPATTPTRAIALADISATFEALAAQVSSSTVQVLAAGLAVDTGDASGVVERRRSSGSGDERTDDPTRFATLVTRERHLVPRLGVLAIAIAEPERAELGLGPDATGVLVAARASEAAAEYGLQAGDLIVAVNGTTVTRLDDLRKAVDALSVHAPCALQVLRQGQFLYLAFEIEE